jgi:1-deoxy-D-xylulose-5-phosphate synthase
MEKLLQQINSPDDLKKLSLDKLPQLAEELREFIVQSVSKTGGHLASSLGTIELTIALHYVFNTPKDRLIWDVGHQAYAHKILTGRRDVFHTLRQHEGISGFLRREESIYDVYNAGHASTAISAALGIAEARDRNKEDFKVVAVIGDGSLSGGLAFEGLNQTGHIKRDIIIILNDNEMSISGNVGALSSYLSRVLTGQIYSRLRKDTKSVLETIPGIGEHMLNIVGRFEDSFRTFISPGMLFEDLGIKYVGPIKGHNLPLLIRTLKNVKNFGRPVLVHVMTKKGKGYTPAEEKPIFYHGVSTFNPETGEPHKKAGPPSYTSIFSKTMVKIGKEDKKVVGITAAMPEGAGLYAFGKEFPERLYDVGIAESHGTIFAAGLAIEGFKPVVAIYSTFIQRAYDAIIHDVCLMNLPVTFVMDRGGLVGEDGPTHHGVFDLSFMRTLPNMICMSPKDENELQHMVKTAIEHPGPSALRYPRGPGEGVDLDETIHSLRIGKAEELREGKDAAIIAIGNMVYPSLRAAEKLGRAGIHVSVINARFVKPLDKELILKKAKETGHLITVEENALQGGFGSAVLELLEQEGVKGVAVKRVGLPDQFIEHGAPDVLREKYGLSEEGIVAAVKSLLGSRQNKNILSSFLNHAGKRTPG